MRALLASALLLLQALPAAAEVLTLLNGDRVHGRIVGPTTRRVRLQTPYGVLSVPREQVASIEHDSGTVEVVSAPAPTLEASPSRAPEPEPARLQIAIRGDTFWQAWEPKWAPADPSLRLELSLDDAPLASYTDVTLDPEDMPKAVVNSFVFSPAELVVGAAPGVVVSPPIIVGSEVGLSLRIPPEAAGRHELRLVYAANDGSRGAPLWRALVSAALPIVVETGTTIALRLQQDRGTMEYSRKRMQGVETFRASLRPEAADGAASSGAP